MGRIIVTLVRQAEAAGVSFEQLWTVPLIFVLMAAQVVGEWVESELDDLVRGRK
ncbi:MAG: hypothetical protein JW850_12895 [Thermoflexales bacterium]|nr:hypothetical protein [Thermoflexales bacterium]